ncbi:MAG: CAP domain-containing protein [Patescibacteria group bacterium]
MKTKQKQIKKPTTVRAKVSHHAKRILVPHKVNGYRPHLIRVHGLIAVLIVAILAQATYSLATAGNLQVLGRSSDIQTAELLSDTNDERAKYSLGQLTLNDKLSNAAFLKAQDMFKNNYWAHTSPAGVAPWKWFGDAGYNYSVAGENLAKNYPSADATVDAWMNSENHRANILNGEYVDVGFAVVDGTLEGRATTLVVAYYGAPVTIEAVQEVAAPVSFITPDQLGSNPLEFFSSAFMSLSPVTIAILAVLAIVAIVGVAAHHYRNKLPKAWKQSWRIHHGMYTFIGVLVLGVLIILATGGGQI